jgi:hypothetical protein
MLGLVMYDEQYLDITVAWESSNCCIMLPGMASVVPVLESKELLNKGKRISELLSSTKEQPLKIGCYWVNLTLTPSTCFAAPVRVPIM